MTLKDIETTFEKLNSERPEDIAEKHVRICHHLDDKKVIIQGDTIMVSREYFSRLTYNFDEAIKEEKIITFLPQPEPTLLNSFIDKFNFSEPFRTKYGSTGNANRLQ